MPKTIKDIEAQIKELEQEKASLEKLEQLKDILGTTTLSVAQIKKAIKDAEKDVKIKPKNFTSKSKKSVIKPKKENVKPKYSKVINCKECGKEFESHSPRQVVCPECKNNKK